MDHKAFLKSMPSDLRSDLTRKNNIAALQHLALHWGLILLFGLYIGFQGPFWGLFIIPQGILISFCFCILHETIHDTPFRSNWLNRYVGRICSVVILLPKSWFQYFHLAHHRFTNDPENDPELNTPKPKTLFEYTRATELT